MAPRKQYSQESLDEAVKMYVGGTKLGEVLKIFPYIPKRTITRRAKQTKENVCIRRPGPQPVLSVELESDLQDWIVEMQRQGFPVSRDTILVKGNELFHELYGNTRSVGDLGRGWINRFMERHPLLTTRTSQVIKRVRAEATEDGLRTFMWEMSKHVLERGLTSDRIFNMDETGFAQKNKAKKVIAVHGSRNVWSKSVEASFHLTIVACVGANGFVVPPLYVVPGQRLNRDVMDACPIDGSAVSVAKKGFMNSALFLRWLDHFSRNVPEIVQRPIVLVYDGYASHYNDEIVERAIQLNIILVLLPANSTHLIQPLDIAIFKPFKTALKRRMEKFMIDNAVTAFSKKDAIEVTSDAWVEGVVNKGEIIVSGFRASGIWPVSFPSMQHRWRLYHNGGINLASVPVAPWITARENIRTEILSLPPPVDRTRKRRKTLDVNNRLLTREQLNSYDN
jgi:hypothetical protein